MFGPPSRAALEQHRRAPSDFQAQATVFFASVSARMSVRATPSLYAHYLPFHTYSLMRCVPPCTSTSYVRVGFEESCTEFSVIEPSFSSSFSESSVSSHASRALFFVFPKEGKVLAKSAYFAPTRPSEDYVSCLQLSLIATFAKFRNAYFPRSLKNSRLDSVLICTALQVSMKERCFIPQNSMQPPALYFSLLLSLCLLFFHKPCTKQPLLHQGSLPPTPQLTASYELSGAESISVESKQVEGKAQKRRRRRRKKPLGKHKVLPNRK